LITGLVLATYLTLHLATHALGLISFGAMEAGRRLISPIWQNPFGTVLLYGSLFLHLAVALRSVYRRTTLRMPAWEAAQVMLGLLLPVLLMSHVIGTRVSSEILGFEVTFPYVITVLWNNTRYLFQQPLLVLIAWVHCIVGLHFWLRLKPWYDPAFPALCAFAVMLPTLALLGFVDAGVSSEQLSDSALDAAFAGWDDADPIARSFVVGLESKGLVILGVLVAGVLLARQIRLAMRARVAGFTIHHSNGRALRAPHGQTLLEALRTAGIPHASACGGRARCTTCRVRVDTGLTVLPEAAPLEATALRRIGAPTNVRLACQTRPLRDVGVTPLVPASAHIPYVHRRGGLHGREQTVTAMFVDLRGSTKLSEARLPFDVVFILNQFFAEMSAAIDTTSGHYAQFAGDGLLALYGLESEPDAGCRNAVRGAIEMSRRLHELNERLKFELHDSLRVGVGIHCGEAIVGAMGPPSSPTLTAIGDNINIAARLESLTKTYACTLVISVTTAERAGADLSRFPRHTADVRGRDEPVEVYAIADLSTLPQP
jgi:adenylate cyclase